MRFALLAVVFGLYLMDPSMTAAAAKRCPASTIAVGSKSKPKACIPKRLGVEDPSELARLVKVKGKPDRKAERIARAAYGRFAGTAARAARRSDDWGEQVGTTTGPDGRPTTIFQREDGVQTRVTGA